MMYPEQRDGKRLIFRWTRRNPKTGKIERPKGGRPFPIWIDS